MSSSDRRSLAQWAPFASLMLLGCGNSGSTLQLTYRSTGDVVANATAIAGNTMMNEIKPGPGDPWLEDLSPRIFTAHASADGATSDSRAEIQRGDDSFALLGKVSVATAAADPGVEFAAANAVIDALIICAEATGARAYTFTFDCEGTPMHSGAGFASASAKLNNLPLCATNANSEGVTDWHATAPGGMVHTETAAASGKTCLRFDLTMSAGGGDNGQSGASIDGSIKITVAAVL